MPVREAELIIDAGDPHAHRAAKSAPAHLGNGYHARALLVVVFCSVDFDGQTGDLCALARSAFTLLAVSAAPPEIIII